jgi:4-hydroxy-tetrahydrodipicolinate synthase
LTQNELSILDYHRELASLGLPLMLFYLYEAAGGISYSPAILRRLLALPEVVGIKLATLDSVMTFQSIANLTRTEFPEKLVITGEDRFLGYSLICGAQGALIGMGAACTRLQHALLRSWFEAKSADFLTLSAKVDRLSQVLFIPPMEGYIRRMLWTLVHQGVLERESTHDPWGPDLPENEFTAIGSALSELGESRESIARGL